ncbi:HAD family hydrolase [Paenibacillus sp. MWE-103]|uniref:HAD family hydrolase n=1 Tax=Paenibacillus artemisiicola TaxID=1172618 RepID=A0ABS3W9Y6_9BACL|nr:HAD family hydrolase [Paenibacillus artemisiicola]MBO7745130.1 HAD family hydrolase [Paenibacillus artemisiicola]
MHNEKWLAAVKVVVFDMDGTLYQDHAFLERYIRYLLEGTEHEGETEAAVRLGGAMQAGEHPGGFGHFYHAGDDVCLALEGERFVRGYNWADGGEIDVGARAYGGYASLAPQLIPIGDPWSIVTALCRRYGLPDAKLRAAFERVRKEMLRPPHQFERSTGLFRAIEALDAVEKKSLLTNTPVESGVEFLGFMGIRHLFGDVIFGADKPAGLHAYMMSLLAQGYEPREILTIGDNAWNDLHPVKRLGGRTCLVSPYPSRDPEAWDLRLARLDELEELMRAMQQSITRRSISDGEDRAEANRQEVQG